MATYDSARDSLLFSLELLKRIPRQRKITARELCEQLRDAGYDRNLRTVQRHLNLLSEHFDIERDTAGKPHGYRWLPQSRGLSIPLMTIQESLLLRLAEEQLRYLLPAHLMLSMDGFFKQARRNLLNTTDTPSLARQWRDKVRVVSTSQPLLPPRIQPAVFDIVSEALYRNQWLALSYRNARKTERDIEIMPLGLAQQGPRLYLVGRYRGYDNERSLAMHRIQSARKLLETFERPRDFDLAGYDEDGRFGFGEGQRIRLQFRIAKGPGYHLLESPLSKDQTVNEEPDHYVIEATVVDSLMLDQWLRGFGEAVWGVKKNHK